MRHIVYQAEDRHTVAVLVKESAFYEREIRDNYITPLEQRGVLNVGLIAVTVSYNEHGKAPASFIKEYLEELLPALDSLGTRYLLVTDAAYFKALTGKGKAEPFYGYVLPCKVKGYEHLHVVLTLNHQQLIYNPALQAKLDLGLDTLANTLQGTYVALGDNIIHYAEYPSTVDEIALALEKLHRYPTLACDLETFSLRFEEAGIGSIAFAWDTHNGIAFACDYLPISNPSEGDPYGYKNLNLPVRKLLKQFFTDYQGELVFHNASYDVKVLIASLWMRNLQDTHGLLEGLDLLTRKLHDTKIIAYLATNSTAGNQLGLKTLAHEYAGNWAKDDIKDIRRIPLKELLEYNLVDTLSTQYVMRKYFPIMVQDQQLDLYNGLMMNSLKLIIQLELTGMPLSKTKVQETKDTLLAIQQKHLALIEGSPVIRLLNLLLQDSAWSKDFEDRRGKAKNPDKILPKTKSAFSDIVFNPNSGPQMQRLLYEQMQLPVLDYTDTKQPATGADTLEKLLNHTDVPGYREIIEALIGYGKVTKILSTFIPAFERALSKDASDTVWLHGNFNLGGTVSGRLSSSDPNLQNIPAGSEYGKLIKQCFVAPKGWLFAGADFSSLEDYISALTTKDPAKLAVYERGFDGHCLRAAYYFRDQCPEIDLDDPASVNSIKKKYPQLRQDSKGPTFALTYQGTWHTLVNNLGFPEDKAKSIEQGYHDLYKVSDQYVQSRLQQAAIDGYVEVAFGLRIRTPLLKQVIFGSKSMPFEAAAEGRTAGNALGQSYGLLNNRAAVEFFQKVWASKSRLDILPVALIHDAIYVLMRDDVEVVDFANRELIKSMRWQELPEIQHPTVKLGAALDIFWPSWATATTLPNDADQITIKQICQETKAEVLKKAT